ncbi:MAG TPA: DUF4383 domain-containing protein [Candidatus Limnocylindrales bacterium]|nr:DUF4383 domain-containing protein [Candidatus Limnocylindrales bacterium]
MYSNGLTRTYAAAIGVILVLVGLLGFVDNPIVGSPNAVFPTGVNHNLVHLATGLLALYVAFGLQGRAQATAVVGFGILYLVIFVALVVSPTLFGLLEPVNVADHVLHAALGLVSLAVGYLARGQVHQTA